MIVPSVFRRGRLFCFQLLIACLLLLAATAPCRGCFTIVVGKAASADGCVLVAHKEDDPPPQIVNHRKVPRRTFSAGEIVALPGGGRIEQVAQTWAYLWSEMPGVLFSDSYVNEWGVCVTSDNCPSREDRGELTDGGLAEWLLSAHNWQLFRRLVRHHPETDHWIEDLSRPGRLTAGLNWYRANLGKFLHGDFPGVEIPVMGIWSTKDMALTEEQMTGSAKYVTGPWRYERIEGWATGFPWTHRTGSTSCCWATWRDFAYG